jgi:pullulanase/glycogen debranching enzyme
MANNSYETVGVVQTSLHESASNSVAKPTVRFDVMKGHLFGQAEDTLGSSLENKLFKDRCPLNGVELNNVGKDLGINFAVNSNPREGFSLHVFDSKEAADELTQYQIMKGGYDGRKRVLTEIHRAYVPELDNPFVTIDMYMRDESIERLLGPLPDNMREGTLDKWREMGWRSEAMRIVKNINGYNPIHNEICRITKKYVVRELTEEEAHYHAKDPDQHLFHEDEIYEVHVTKVATLPKIRYLNGLFTVLNQIRDALDIKG